MVIPEAIPAVEVNPVSNEAERYTVKRAEQPIRWEADVPASKSILNRALLLAALSDGTAELANVSLSEDTRAFLGALRSLGFSAEITGNNDQVIIEGKGGDIPRSGCDIDVESSGTTARFLTAMLGVSGGSYRIFSSAQMQQRPMRPLFEALLSLGAQITWLEEEWHLPVEITGAADTIGETRMPLELDISESTQFLSALLMIAPMYADGMQIRITGEKKDGPYIRMTRRMMQEFGVTVRFTDGEYILPAGAAYKRERYTVEPDVSAACYFYAAAAVTGGYARVNGVYSSSIQGDMKFLDVLEEMGCEVSEEPDGIAVTGPAAGRLSGISVNMRDFSDQALTLAAIAPYADGPVEITGIAHVRGQESDRIRSIVTNLHRAGISCEEFPDGVRILPGRPQPCRIDPFDDHRVAMAFAVMGLGADGIVIENPSCCKKTFVNYFELLTDLVEGQESVR